MSESSANMKFTAQTADAQKRIAELEKEVSRLSKETKDSGSASSSAASGLGSMGSSAVAAVAGIAAATAAVKALVSAAKECIEALKVQEQAETRLSAVLKATGNQIGMNVTELKALASATQSITRFGDEAVIEAEKVLIATQSLDKDGLQRAIMASADLAEAMGTDIVSAASTMAYALQDPEQGLSRLRRQGIAFTDEEIAQVKALQDANDLYGAQAIVLEKIESRYKGVAKAVGDTPTGTLDKIKNVWGDIKEGLGGALVDALGPAIELVYQGLLKISEWINRARAAVKTEQEVKVVTDRLNKNEGFEGIEDDVLMAAIDQYTRDKQTSNLRRGLSEGTYNKWISLIQTELDSRAAARAAELSLVIPTASSSGSSGSSPVTEDPAWKSFFGKYGNESTGYRATQYQAIIDEATALRSQMRLENGNFNKTTREAWGVETLDEFVEIYNQLGEIIDTTQAKKDKLFEEPEQNPEWLPTDYLAEYNTAVSQLESQLAMLDQQIEETTDPATLKYLQGVRDGLQDNYDQLTDNITPAVKTLQDFLKENSGLSASAQVAMLDAQIAEAEMWKQSESAGEAEIRILDEIINKWKEQRDEIGKTGKTWQDNVKEFLGTWSPAINKFQGLTSAVVQFQQQLWDNQADELEAALERDKQTGDMSESEEKERLARIDDLRRKSFEAQKANSISNALINGALAVTQCLTEGIPGYVMAGIVAATTAVQVATIASQQYTPMAKGGIVTQATPIIAGEAGPEAIIPLSGGRAQQYLGNAGSVVINITIEGNADEEVVFHAIERAQRTGYLPNWSYA